MALDLSSLYETEVDGVHAFIGRFGLRGADLEDAVHDTFLIALSRASTHDPSRPVRPWLLGIAFRMAVARLRAPKKTTHEVPDQADPAQNPERDVAERQTHALVRRAISELSEEQGLVLMMYDLEGIPVAEISASMGAPVATTYSRLRLARQAFAAAVQRLQPQEHRP